MLDISLSITLMIATAFWSFKNIAHIHFIINTSLSLPYRLVVLCAGSLPKKGCLTVISHPRYGRLIKILQGVEGDTISYDAKGNVCVEGQVVGKPYVNHLYGELLTRISPGVIPKGYVFLAGTNPRSMDSRYTTIGLVPVSMLQGSGWGFLKRKG